MPGFPNPDLDEAYELGAVDERGVRLWARRPDAPRVEATLRVTGQPPVSGVAPLAAETDWTGVVALSLPQPAPEAAFTCEVAGRSLSGRLAPLPGTRTALTFGFGSCSMPYAALPDGRVGFNRAAGIYEPAAALLQQQDARFLVLVGDQIYADGLPGISVRDALAPATLPAPEVALAAYHRIYRGYFGLPGYRRLRETLPVYTMWDDHEIFDDWGSRLRESELDRRLFAAAARAYCEYQHVRNPGGRLKAPPFPYSFQYGDVGFLALDLRGARDYDSGHLLGREQWEWTREYLRTQTTGIVTMFVVASVPVAQVSRWFVAAVQALTRDGNSAVRDRWCSRHFLGARDALLDELMAWQQAVPGRQAILLSGDVHAAGAFTIRERRGRGVVQQFTSSALSTQPGWRQSVPLAVAARLPNLLETRWRFRRRLACYANNIGLIRLVPRDAGGHRVDFAVYGWLPRQRRLYRAGNVSCVPEDV